MTFTEVMFAVILLGIGFIMLAAMFPVAIQQAKSTSEETEGAALGRSALNFMEQMSVLQNGTTPLMVATGGSSPAPVVSIPQTNSLLWTPISGNLIRSDDPRYAWVPLYKRDPNSPYAQVFLFAVQNRNRSTYTSPTDVAQPTATVPATLEARLVSTNITAGVSGAPDTITISAATGANAANPQAAGDGGFLVLVNSGLILRLGAQVTGSTDTWNLAPGYDLNSQQASSLKPTGPGLLAYIVGRGYSDPTAPANGYDGTVQDVGCYTSFVRVN
ncbi:MAG TPA: hypothetical protein VIL86_05280 [Tepidisphaeraceae bacterium]